MALGFGATVYISGCFGVSTYIFGKSRFDVLVPGVWSRDSGIIGMIYYDFMRPEGSMFEMNLSFGVNHVYVFD